MANNILKPTLPAIMRPGIVGAVNMTLTDECVIERGAEGFDANGENTITWLPVETAACRVMPDNRRNTGDNSIGGKETGRDYYRFVLPVGVDVQHGDRIAFKGKVYEVLRISSEQTDALFIGIEAAGMDD